MIPVKGVIFTLIKDILLPVIYDTDDVQKHSVEHQLRGHDLPLIFRIKNSISIVGMIKNNPVHIKVLPKIIEDNCTLQVGKHGL
jgi:hypothetical protein